MNTTRIGRAAARASALALAATIGAATPSAAQLYDHLECFKMKDAISQRVQISVTPLDTAVFPITAACTVKTKARELCVPTEKTLQSYDGPAEPIAGDNLTNGFVCYTLKCDKSDIDDTEFTDQFGTRTLLKFGEKKICAPATVASLD